MSRALATIRQIVSTAPIEGADLIELAYVDGWQVVVSKNEFKAGDLAVYFEIDSFLPASDPRYEFLRDRFHMWDGKEGMRLKTIKLRKQLSQGLLIPVHKFPEITNTAIGLDVTDVLKIEKWETKEEAQANNGFAASGSKTRAFPFFIPRTDETRAQNIVGMLKNCLDEEFEVSIKKDGSSLTKFFVRPECEHYEAAAKMINGKNKVPFSWKRLWKQIKVYFKIEPPERKRVLTGLCSRNLLLANEGQSNFHKAVEVGFSNVDVDLMDLYGSFAFQGEVVAPNIQNNHEKVEDVQFHLFNIFDIEKGEYLKPKERKLITQLLGLPHVTVIFKGTLRAFLELKEGESIIDKLRAKAEGPSDNSKVKREGLVFKSMNRDFSFKIVADSYLLAKG